MKIYECDFKIKIYREKKITTEDQTNKDGGGAELVIWKQNHMSMKPFFRFHKDAASVWWPEPSHKRVHHGAKLGIIQFVWPEEKFEYLGQFLS